MEDLEATKSVFTRACSKSSLPMYTQQEGSSATQTVAQNQHALGHRVANPFSIYITYDSLCYLRHWSLTASCSKNYLNGAKKNHRDRTNLQELTRHQDVISVKGRLQLRSGRVLWAPELSTNNKCYQRTHVNTHRQIETQ